MLLTCHQRLRHFSELGLAVASRPIDEALVVDACRRLRRHFLVALPLHESDEEQTLAPALGKVARPIEAEALAQMRDQHVLLHEILAELLPMWESAERDARSLDRAALLVHARRLTAVLDVHLELEETMIFPMLTWVEGSERKRLLAEMRVRRTPDVMNEMAKIM